MRKLVPFCFVVFVAVSSLAQSPAGYYDSATGKSCAALKSALKQILINSHIAKPYDSLYNEYKISDVKPREVGSGSATVIWDIYSDVPNGNDPYNYDPTGNKCGNYSKEGDCYNREHTIPKSWFDDALVPSSDLIQILPVDGYINGRRGNYPYGEVANATYTSKNGSKLGNSAIAGISGTVFEPIDEFKGDLARIFFYYVTRYQDNLKVWSGNSTALSFDTFPSININYLKMMLNWNAQDPISQKEIDRNNAAYTYQGNRNPYIDHPEYIGLVWGSNCPGLSTLPVNILFFTGKLNGNTVALNWQTGSEINFAYFEVEKSFDGNSYKKIATVSAHNGSYNYTDNIAADRGRTVYYRLKKVDKDGSFTYSNVFSLQVPAFLQFSVYPNPAKDIVHVLLKQTATNIYATITDVTGRVLIAKQYGNTGTLHIPVTQLAKGVYYLKVDAGNNHYFQKIIIGN